MVSTVTAVIARHFATRDGTMRASHAVLAFGLLVASAATVTANHNSDVNNDPIDHFETGNELDGAPLSKFDSFAVTRIPADLSNAHARLRGRTPSASHRAESVSSPYSRSARGS